MKKYVIFYFFLVPFLIKDPYPQVFLKLYLFLLYYANYKMNFPYYVYTDIDELYQAICEKIKSLEK